MKNTIKKVFLAVLIVLASALGASAQQNTLTTTTLAAAVPGNILGQGPTGSSAGTFAPTTIQVASATGIVGYSLNQTATINLQNQSALYVDHELMYVQSVSGTTLTVLRGQGGSKPSPHASGAIVWIGKPVWFYAFSPSGACAAANVVASPWVNVKTGSQFLCDSTTGIWLPSLATATITPAATAAAIGVAVQTFTLTGVISGQPLIASVYPAQTALCPLVSVRATAANTVSLGFAVLTAAACTPASGVYQFFSPLHNNGPVGQ